MTSVSLQRYLYYSLLVHGLIVVLMFFLNRQKLKMLTKPEVVTFEILDQSRVKVLPESKEDRKIIVDQERLNDDIDPLSNYLSSHNQKVNKETIAKNHGEFKNRKMTTKAAGPAGESSARATSKALPRDLFGSSKESLAKSFEKQVQREKGGGGPGGDVSQTRDYLPDKEAGMETLLSTREFVYYTYYNRIRNQLSQYWEPKIKQKILALFKQGRRIASTQDRITKVQIVLDSKGLLLKVQVLGESGVQDLDQVAVEAFRAAAPFPNPPKGIIDSDGTVKILWDFVIET